MGAAFIIIYPLNKLTYVDFPYFLITKYIVPDGTVPEGLEIGRITIT